MQKVSQFFVSDSIRSKINTKKNLVRNLNTISGKKYYFEINMFVTKGFVFAVLVVGVVMIANIQCAQEQQVRESNV